MSATITATEPEWRPLDLTFPAQPNQTDAAWAAVGKQYVSDYRNASCSFLMPSQSTCSSSQDHSADASHPSS